MTQGTVSVILGGHSIVHSLLVVIAWHHLYGKLPCFWEFTCILLHDVGHIGKQYLDDVEAKNKHWILGARIARKLFGSKGYDLIAGHSNVKRSKLYKPDKYSWYIAPSWWLLSNTLFEPKLKMGYSARTAITKFKQQVKLNIESGEYRSTHELYLERCNGKGVKDV